MYFIFINILVRNNITDTCRSYEIFVTTKIHVFAANRISIPRRQIQPAHHLSISTPIGCNYGHTFSNRLNCAQVVPRLCPELREL
jgi:hypothetical protein